ncbi:hypothetical protein I4U23_004646 [Adineta vaga]|nr:hypothetical protein I4U23_004646 [Adineta vaga]
MLDVLKADLEQGEKQSFHIGFKLVRGEYMIQERKRAIDMGYEDPPSFLTGMEFALNKTNRITRIFDANHNENMPCGPLDSFLPYI